MRKRVIIVGAGPGGLASALLLAKAGLDVTILERAPASAGAPPRSKSGGFRFDLGPTFFLFPLSLRRIFTAIGRDFDAELPMVPARSAVPSRVWRRRRPLRHARRRADGTRDREVISVRRRSPGTLSRRQSAQTEPVSIRPRKPFSELGDRCCVGR